MNNAFFARSISLLILVPGLSHAQFSEDAEAWERDEALRASESVNTQTQRNKLQSLLKAGESEASLALIQNIQNEESWPAPARERVIYEYVTSLRHETPRVVGKELLSYLQNYQSTVLVPHEDHPSGNVPLFNIKGAAAGVVNGWTRQEAAFKGAALILEDPDSLPLAYLSESSLPAQQGLLDSLDTASPTQLKSISGFALRNLETYPQLVAVASKSALISMDQESLLMLAESGYGAGIHTLFSVSVKQLDKVQIQQLLQAALRNPSHETAALAIAQLGPALSGNEPSESLLLEMLGDPKLGSSAALALVVSPSNKVLLRLQALAVTENNEPAAIRARLALDMYASRLLTGAQQ